MGTRVGQSWRAADLSSVQAGVMQAQQQRHETLQHQLPQGTSEPQAEAAAAFPHQRPQEPYRRGADGVPGLRGRARSGGARGGGDTNISIRALFALAARKVLAAVASVKFLS